jgi:DNA-binding transcriptional ArsR family regulator
MAMSKMNKNDAVITALGHPVRRAILRRLENNANGGLSPKELADELHQGLGNVSYHVRVLLKTGVIKLVTTKPRRGAIEHYYRRTGNHLDRKATEVLHLVGKD